MEHSNFAKINESLEIIKKFFGERGVNYYKVCFEKLKDIKRFNRALARISSAKDKEQLIDYLAEIRYALIFLNLGFEIEFEPLGDKGPDLGVTRDSQKAVVEITRFRKIYDGPPNLDLNNENFTLVAYGNPKRDIQKSFGKILAKFPQIEGEKGIIAIWNDDEDLDETEMSTAVFDISKDKKNDNILIPSDLLFILYGSKWIIGGKQLFGYPLNILDEPFASWINELESVSL